MAANKKLLVILMLSMLAVCLGQIAQGGPHTSQGGPHENQGRPRREALQDEGQTPKNWTTCDMTISPKVSCHDCSTRLICKPVGGLLLTCNNPMRPHCNNGICSATPSPACA